MAESPADLHAEIEKYERKHAENPDGRNFAPLADAYRKLGELGRAESLLRDGLRRHPDYLSAHIVLGRTLADRGLAAEAASEFRHVLGIDPQNLIALRTLGEMATAVGRSDEAGHWYRELLAVDPMNEEARQVLAEIESPPLSDARAASEPEMAPVTVEEVEAREEIEVPDFDAPLAISDEEALASDRDLPGSEDFTPERAGGDLASEDDGIGLDLLDWDAAAEPALNAASGAAIEPDAVEQDSWAALPEVEAKLPEAATAAGEIGSTPPEDAFPFEVDAPLAHLPDFGDTSEDGGDAELVTETIAELYARQGFRERAADMYRELIRRRGEVPEFTRRLRELEMEAEEDGTRTQAPARSGNAFADSFAFGFAGSPAPVGAVSAPEIGDIAEDVVAGSSLSNGAESTAAGDPGAAVGIGEYFGDLLSWRPRSAGSTGESPHGTEAEVAAESPEIASGDDPLTDGVAAAGWEERQAQGTSELSGAQSVADVADATAGAEDDFFPWEQPDSDDTGHDPQSVVEEPWTFSGEAFEPEVEAAAPAAPEKRQAGEPRETVDKPHADPAGMEGTGSLGAGDDEDDLESFQAWLRSLKR